jgi:hypothetical protein
LRRTSEAVEQRVLELKQEGHSQRAIAEQLKMPRSTVALILKRAPEYETPLATGGRISAHRAAKQYGLKPPTLNDAIDAGIVRGEATVSGRYVYRTVDPAEFEEDVAKRRGRTCTYPPCTADALLLSDRCMKHTGHVTEPGHAPKGSEARARMAVGREFLKRPDVVERYRHDWDHGGPLTLGLCYDNEGKSKDYFTAEMREKHLPKWAGPVAELRGKKNGRDAAFTPDEDRQILDDYNSGITQDVLADRYGVTRKTIRGALDRARRGEVRAKI